MNSKSPKMNPEDVQPSYLYPLIGVGIIGVSMAAVLIRLSDAPSLVIAAYRMLFTFLIISPFALAKQLKQNEKIGIKNFCLSAASGLFLALHFAFWITSLEYTSVASSTIIVTTQPLFVVIGSNFIFGERVPKNALIFMLLAFLGSFILGYGDFFLGDDVIKGDLLALGGAVFFAGYILIGRHVRQELEVLPYTSIVYGMSALFLIIACYVSRLPLISYGRTEYLIFISLAFFSTVMGHTIFNWAVKYVSAVVVSTSILGEPIGATVLAAIILGESPNLWQIMGGGLIIFSLYHFIKINIKEK